MSEPVINSYDSLDGDRAMSNIVERLREHAPQMGHYGAHYGGVLMSEAANLIERQRSVIEAARPQSRQEGDRYCAHCGYNISRGHRIEKRLLALDGGSDE